MSRRPRLQDHILLDMLHERPEFQLRVGGLDQRHVRKLADAMRAGSLPPITVARIGSAHYILDGFHRVAAARELGLQTIGAAIEVMTHDKAQAFALSANTSHGKPLTRADKQNMWSVYSAQGRHLSEFGRSKPSRLIERELGGIYSHETIRKRLMALGLELSEDEEFPDGYKERFPADDDRLSAERLDDALAVVRQLRGTFFDLEPEGRRTLLHVVTDLAAEINADPDVIGLEPEMF